MDFHYKNIKGLNIRVGVSEPTGRNVQELPLLLCNGIGASMELLKPFVQAMTNTRIVAFDPPGIGKSELSDKAHRFGDLAEMAVEIMEQLGFSQFNTMGVSWGGGLAQVIARNHRDSCRNLILAATGPGLFMIPGKLSVLKQLSSPRRYTDPDYAKSITADIYGGVFRKNPELYQELTRHGIPPTDQGYQNQLNAGVGWSSIWWLHSLKQPTLILMGKDDPIVPSANGLIFKNFIRKADLQLVDCGHLFMVTRPNEVSSRVETFLDVEEGFEGYELGRTAAL